MTLRMVRAELLKLVHQRMLVIVSLLLTVGLAVIVMVVPELYRLRGGDAAAPVGGYSGLQRGSITLVLLGAVVAMIVGAEAGAGDLSTGIFRDLVATGRSRLALFAARVPGALAFFVPLVTVAFVVMAALDDWFAPAGCGGPVGRCAPLRLPGFGDFARTYGWVLAVTTFDLLLALGVAALLGTRGVTLGTLLPFQLIVSPLLSDVDPLGRFRDLLFTQSFAVIAPAGLLGGPATPFGEELVASATLGWLVLLLWLTVATTAGALRTATRDA